MEQQQRREINGSHFGDNNTIVQGDVHNHLPKDREDEKNQCLSDLRITDPRHDKLRIENTKGGLLEDSYRWIFEHSDFQRWHDNKDRPLLWIKGDPGKGKTMLLCGIINKLQGRRSPKTLMTYFFCQAGDSRINSATAVLRGLIYLAIDEQPQLISHIQNKYRHGKKTIFEDINAWTAMSEVFSAMLNDTSLEQSFVVIDALDECATGLRDLLEFINTKSALLPQVKWIVSSRNWPEIEESLNSSADQQTRLCLELNDESVTLAVDVYIKYQVERLKLRRKFSKEVQRTLLQELSTKSNNTFLWVSLVCQNLEKTTSLNILEKLDEFPSGLDSVYQRMIQQINAIDGINNAKYCFQTLGIILHVYRPVSLVELGCLFRRDDGNPATAEFIARTIALCGSFLAIREGKVYIIHQSAKDYLNATTSPGLQPGFAEIPNIIFEQSIEAMAAVLQRNIYNLDTFGLPISQIKRPRPDPLESIGYSCTHWVNHFCDIYPSNGYLHYKEHKKYHQMTLEFLLGHFLHWVEALGLIKCTEDGVISLVRLEALLKLPNRESSNHQLPSIQLLELVQDARRYIQHNISIIAHNPLQAYTIVRKLFHSEEPNWLKVKPNVDYDWTPCLHTLNGHKDRVIFVAFSTTGYLVSGELDGTIKIWDMKTCREKAIIHNGDVTQFIVSSADGRYLAASCGASTIKIWDLTTGKEQQVLQDIEQPSRHKPQTTPAALSIDGRYLALTWNYSTIKLWDVISGKEQQTPEFRRGNPVTSITFSAHHHLALGVYDGSITIWDITSKRHQTFKDDYLPVTSIIFSTHNRYLASSSRKAQRIFRVEMPIQLGNLSVFSADSRYFAFANGKTIEIWDVETGKEHQTLRGRSKFHSLAFSENDIWEVTMDKDRHTINDYAVNSVALSADGKYLASGGDDCLTRIWDTTTGKELAFSADGQYLASASPRCIKIWDSDLRISHGSSLVFSMDGRYLAWKKVHICKTLEYSSSHNLLAFSAGSRYLASAADATSHLNKHFPVDTTISIWDLRTQNKRRILQGHSNWITSITFSPDNRYLASGSMDGTIRIWNTETVRAMSFDSTASILPVSQVLSPAAKSAKDRRESQLAANNTQSENEIGYALSLDTCWITWNGHGILWLPPEYRSLRTISPMTDVIIAFISRPYSIL
ncbi:WD40-repeat-containing domain protein [Trichoderma sp. TUCIM 5745]